MTIVEFPKRSKKVIERERTPTYRCRLCNGDLFRFNKLGEVSCGSCFAHILNLTLKDSSQCP